MPSLDSRLILVTDRQRTKGRSLVSVLRQALNAGKLAIQLRERDLHGKDVLALAEEIDQLVRPCGSQLLINDRLDVALSLDQAGAHLRSDSLPISMARRVLGGQRLLGVSVHSVREAVEAEAGGADYVVLGPIYETPSKQIYGPPLGLPILEEVARRVHLPVIGIGGVTAARARDMRLAGAFGIAVITAVLGADDVEAATRGLLDAVRSVSSSTGAADSTRGNRPSS
jgi:thiamine-phosphate pyrophosphorylase